MYSMRPGPPGIIRTNPKNSSADSLLSLYHKIPEYSEVKHLGNSDFIRAIEQLKEEFRQCRADLYTSSPEDGEESDEGVNKFKSCSPARKLINIRNTNDTQQQNDFLKVKGHQSQMHRTSGTCSFGNNYAINYLNYNKPSRSLSFNFDSSLRSKSKSRKDDLFSEDDDDDFDSESCGRDSNKWSSSPDLRDVKDYVPPSNVERRILERKSHNQSAPSLFCPTENENEKPLFKAHPVPSHVYKPLYEFIMLKNQRRSQKVREHSKQRLMAQVKPFSFTKEKNSSSRQLFHGSFGQKSNQEKAQQSSTTQFKEVLNNMKPIKPKRACSHSHTNNLKSYNHFKANPAPPRTKALMSALKLKEQQEYRELKKRLRSETLLKNATLPPSMAARDKRTKLSNAKLDAIIQEYQNSCNSARDKNFNNSGSAWSRNQSTDVDDTAFTDEDRLSEDSYRYLNSAGNPPSSATVGENHNPSSKNKRLRNFTPFGKSRHSSAASGIFECTSNDNLASRLRIQATRKKEAERIKREEEELLMLMKNENRRKKLRDSHFAAWRKAHSYSSSQDIAMRRQLRLAASILERESFIRDMSSMLCRVRSAPLLLEGVRERRFEPCRKHRDELNSNNQTSATGLTSRPKSFSTSNYFFQQYGLGDNDGQSRSETAAMAEGSLSDDTANSSENSDIDDEEEDKKDFQQSNTATPKPTPTPRKGLGQKKQLRIQSQSEDDNDEQIKDNQN